jgi:hypothetical protein
MKHVWIGFKSGLATLGAFIVLPLQALWFVCRKVWRLHGLEECYELSRTMKYWDDCAWLTDKGCEMVKEGK